MFANSAAPRVPAMRNQATKANPAQVAQHIARQRRLGERMIGDNDQPTKLELLVSGVVLLALIFL